MRNPLAPIRAAAQVLGHPKVSPEEAAWVRGVIQRQVRQIARLLDDLLDASRITQGKLTLRQEWARLAGIVETAVDAARPLLDRKRHRLSVALPDDDLRVYADPVRLAQVLGNLLTNAAKYTDDGGDIAIRAEQVDGELRIAVTDNGLGIAPQALASVVTLKALKRADPSFTPQTYGHSGLVNMLKTYDLLDLRLEPGGHWSVALAAPPADASGSVTGGA